MKKIVIIGGVAGGASAAVRLRRLDEQAEIVMFEKDAYISYANCGLPYYIGGSIQERSKLLVQTPEMMKSRFNIDVRVNSEVIKVDPERKIVLVRRNGKEEYEESFDYLILAPGARPIRPKIEGIDHPRIVSLRNIPDTDRLKQIVDQDGIRNVTVVGGGFIGVEMAEVLTERGLSVTLVEAAPHILSPFDADMVTIAEEEMQKHGVRLILGDSVTAFTEAGEGLRVQLKSGGSQEADLVILAIGVTPETGFLRESGIKLGPRGHILVNEHLQTNCKDIYAVGDAIEVTDFVSGRQTTIPLAGPANKQGRIAADHICGLPSTYKGSQGTSILKIFGLTAAGTGNNERILKMNGVPFQTAVVHPNSHAGYYPGASSITLKLLFNAEGKILGAQAYGREGVDKRIDVIATVMRLKGSVYDLTELELSYAPPYSSAKDPVNMLGYVAENALSGLSPIVSLEDVHLRDTEAMVLLDVRSRTEFDAGHIPGAVYIPVDELRGRLNELNPAKPLMVYCQVGYRGNVATRILRQHGYNAANLTGGYKSFEIASFRPSARSKK
ncbi:FAD-dependent oxidoreductase [Gordoniibacillus kamchatkensis]|uniref:FAD-dependent oxidoreductase n=1 Tax=Gordoniibacillus kamchatkensis TaxID=1590651 RepID=UPI0006978968|nr:FAD-dependent oxidoreductase [Paenibacillus sp. VKM B-2647]